MPLQGRYQREGRSWRWNGSDGDEATIVVVAGRPRLDLGGRRQTAVKWEVKMEIEPRTLRTRPLHVLILSVGPFYISFIWGRSSPDSTEAEVDAFLSHGFGVTGRAKGETPRDTETPGNTPAAAYPKFSRAKLYAPSLVSFSTLIGRAPRCVCPTSRNVRACGPDPNTRHGDGDGDDDGTFDNHDLARKPQSPRVPTSHLTSPTFAHPPALISTPSTLSYHLPPLPFIPI